MIKRMTATVYRDEVVFVTSRLTAVHKGKVIREKHEGFGNDQFLTTKGLQIEDKVISNWKPRLKALGFTHMRFDGDWSNLERPKPVTL